MNEMVFAYTRKRAIADGALIDVTERAKEAGMLLPVGLTRGVWAECVAVPGGLEGQDEAGCLWHVLRTCYRAICRNREVGPTGPLPAPREERQPAGGADPGDAPGGPRPR